jgi:hypothetical protein
MKNVRKLISVFLCLVMMLSLGVTAFAEEADAGTELTQEQLENVAGGTIWCRFVCDTEDQCPVQWEH